MLRYLDNVTITDDIEMVIRYLDSREIIKHKQGNPGRKKKPEILDCTTAFDIETSTISIQDHPQAFMYIWQWAFSKELVLIGRTWEEFLTVVYRLNDYLETRQNNLSLVVFDFNLSFEFQFFKGIWQFTKDDVFCMDRRKILNCRMQHIEFRCAYLHSNMSLDVFCKKMGGALQKQTGTLDYSIVRYPWTELTDTELKYAVYDCIALIEAIEIEMRVENDNLESIPATSTGYVRRDAVDAIRSNKNYFHELYPIQPDMELFQALRLAFRGGDTHANRFYAGHISENVNSVDRSSSYPDVLINHKYPLSIFKHYGAITMERLRTNLEQHKRAAVFRIALWNVKLKDPYCGCPYLARDKCQLVHGAIFDNGRILEARYFETCVTDIDWRIITEQYTFENPCIYDSWFATYKYLPDRFRNIIREYYRKKTELKDVGNDELENAEILYGKMKNRLNSLYGMTAYNCLKPDFIFNGIDYGLNESITDAMRLQKQNKKAFIPYQVGVWCTAWARWELHRIRSVIDEKGCFVYCDTDSVKYIGDFDKEIEKYNQICIQRSKINGAFATDTNGVTHYTGVYEKDKGTPYKRFKTLGAKKYAYEDNAGKLHVTVSGVNKEKGSEELAEHGGLAAFAPGMVFKKAGGTESVYNDNVNFTMKRKVGWCISRTMLQSVTANTH